jgi:hypothetical protein
MRVVNIDMWLPLSRSCAGNILALSPNRVGPEQAEAQAAGRLDPGKFLARQALLEAHFTSCGGALVSTP